ncbi:MAG: hypothetical protein AB8E15_00590 [Bdellovibrionales bacterium]
MNTLAKKLIKDESGSLTVDFVFGLMIVMASFAIFFALTFTLSTIEVAQYIAFSSSRTFAAAHQDPATQESRAQAKFDSLLSRAPFKGLFSRNGWFRLDYQKSGSMLDEFPETSGDFTNALFIGSKLEFRSLIMEIEMPVLGISGDGLRSPIYSFLGREVSFSECKNFFNNRWNNIKNIDSSYSSVSSNSDNPPVQLGNGC